MQSVVELPTFIRACDREGLTKEAVTAIVDLIAASPEAGDVMAGTGGCRKVRVARKGGGKSGGYRLITFFSGEMIPTFLITIYGKNVKDNLSDSECKVLTGLTTELVEAYKPRVEDMRSAG